MKKVIILAVITGICAGICASTIMLHMSIIWTILAAFLTVGAIISCVDHFYDYCEYKDEDDEEL